MSLLSTIQSTINWYGADSVVHTPLPGKGLLTVIKVGNSIYVETSVHYWQEQGIWIDPSGDPIEGEVILWAYTQSIAPKEAK